MTFRQRVVIIGWLVILASNATASDDKTVLADCTPPFIRLRISLSMAHAKPWPHSEPRSFAGRKLHVATTHTVDQGDLANLRLEARDGKQMIVMKLSPEGTRKLADATVANVGEWMVESLGTGEKADAFAVQLDSPIKGGRWVVVFSDGWFTVADICKSP
jgi:hypothetical protein